MNFLGNADVIIFDLLPRLISGTNGGAVKAIRTTTMVTTIDGVTPTNALSNPYPGGLLPALNDRNPLANTGQSITAPIYAFRNGYAQLWSLAVQRELPAGIIAEVYYWGNKGTALLNTWNYRSASGPISCSRLGAKRDGSQPVCGPGTGGHTGFFQHLLTAVPSSLSPVHIGTAGLLSYRNSNYNAFTAQAEKRLSPSITFLTSYTRAKAIDDDRTPLDVYNRGLERGLSSFDVRNMFRLSAVW